MNLDDNCGEFLSFRDLIECGETFVSLQPHNTPEQIDTFLALSSLAHEILDPVMKFYGKIQITYGFAGPQLTKNIKKNICPHLDQHSSHELNKKGELICRREGAAVDFSVPNASMSEVSKWIIKNCNFDRLYFYENFKPIHISYAPHPKRSIVWMYSNASSGKRFPRNISESNFLVSM